MKILLTGGGTGGHLVPLLSIVAEIRKRAPEARFLFVGPRSDFNQALSGAGIEVREVKAGKLRRYFSWENFLDVFNTLIGTDQAFFHILSFRPDVIFSKGGFASVPVVLAASYTRIPVLAHESDTVPGLANRMMGRFARKTFISFPETRRHFPDHKIILSGNPIRQDILAGNASRGRIRFGLEEGLPVLLVFGGSQGAQHINQLLLEKLPQLLEKFQVIHVCGSRNLEEIEKRVAGMNLAHPERYHPYAYLEEEMKDAFACADFVISRAGANSLAEIMALMKPSLIIPLPSAAGNHQFYNAKHFADQGLALMAEEKELDGDKLLQKLEELQSRRDDVLAKLKQYNESLGGKRPEEIIAEEILNVGKR